MLPILVLMIDSDRFVTNFGPKNHATWPFLSMPWAVIRGWAIIQVWAINREFTVSWKSIYLIFLLWMKTIICPSVHFDATLKSNQWIEKSFCAPPKRTDQLLVAKFDFKNSIACLYRVQTKVFSTEITF